MTILVTGGAGFIGSAAAARFLADGHSVVVLDNFNTYYDQGLKHARVDALLPGVTVHNIDITDKAALDDLFSAHTIDVVAHFAAQAGVRYSVEAPESYVHNNVLGTQTLLEVMQQHGVKRMVFASTSSVYGRSTTAPFTEHSPADSPVSVYAATKRAAELIAHSYYVQYGIETTCLRFFTVYGPWSRPDMAMLKFADLMAAHQPIDVYNQGDMRRDFTYVDDIVDGFAKAIETPLGFEIINLGNGRPVELLAFVELLEQLMGVTATKHLLPMQQGDVEETYADTEKAKQLLHFEATTTFAEGVRRFVEWYRVYNIENM